MRIALCAPFMEADLLEQRIKDSAFDEEVVIDEYSCVDTLLEMAGLSVYDAVWIAFPGVFGKNAVIRAREKSRDISIVWISDDKKFASTCAGYRLAMCFYCRIARTKNSALQ